jgi:hypothetical protein
LNRKKGYVAGVLVVVLIVASAIAYLSLSAPSPRPEETTMTGSMFVSDAGRSHGGFEYTASWNATLFLTGKGTGTLDLALDLGLGDALNRHNFTITGFVRNSSTVSMLLDGQPVIMRWTTNDTVWNETYSNYYIASWGSDAPVNELIGKISPTMFPGLASFWYVELRLR